MKNVVMVRRFAFIVAVVFFASCGGSSEKKAAEAKAAQEAQATAEQEAAAKAAADKAAQEEAAKAAQTADQSAAQKSASGKPADPAAQAKAAEAKAQAVAAAEAAAKAKQEAEAAKVVAAQAKAEAVRVAALDVPDPVIATAGGVFGSSVSVTIDKKLKESLMSYTLDGSAPTPESGLRYSGPIPLSSSAILKAIAFVPGGKQSGVVSADYTIGEVCVASGGTGIGSRTSPLGSISAAMAKAKSLGIGTVKLAAGPLSETLDVTSPIAISGSWKTGFVTQGGDRTVLSGTEPASSSKKAPGYALRVSSKAADGKTRFERIEFRGPSSSYGAGIVVSDGAAPEFVSCSSYGGSGSYGYGAMSMQSAAPTFRSCRLDGGGGATSYGLSVDESQATLVSSLALAGSGSVGGYGVSATGAKVTVSGSVLAGNAANISCGAAFYNSKGSSIKNSTIVGGAGKDVAGVFISSSDPAIENCVIWSSGSGAKNYGITANYGDSAPSNLSGTVFIGCAGGLYYEAGTKTAYAAVDSSGRIQGRDGKAPDRSKGDGNSIGSFQLGAAPAYAVPSGAAGNAGAPAGILSAISQ